MHPAIAQAPVSAKIPGRASDFPVLTARRPTIMLIVANRLRCTLNLPTIRMAARHGWQSPSKRDASRNLRQQATVIDGSPAGTGIVRLTAAVSAFVYDGAPASLSMTRLR
jgi:hypothetical protein